MWCGCLEPVVEGVARALSRPTIALDRRQALKGIAATLSLAVTGCAPAATSAHREAAARLLDDTVSVDLHSHPGMVRVLARATMDGHIERLAKGRVRAALFSAVGDGPLLTLSPQGKIYAQREPQPGELYQSAYAQLQPVRSRVASGKLALVERVADLERARNEARPAAILAVEGGDFLEGRLDRVQEAYARGIRSIQLVHYRVNELGDIQTEPPRHRGLTPFGRDVIREMNRLGMLVDVAHATFDGVKAAVETSSKPVVLSHTVVGVPGFARAVSRDHARLVPWLTVRYSVLSPDVRVNSYTEVDSTIMFSHVNIGRHCRIRRAIIDRDVHIPEGTTIGFDPESDRQKYFVTDSGITVVTRDYSLFENPVSVDYFTSE